LSANDALKLCTLNGAIQMGVDKYVGSIEPGKFADMAIRGHPRHFSKCVLTLID
jgi:imidazolonepropionase-like amidohydrolase